MELYIRDYNEFIQSIESFPGVVDNRLELFKKLPSYNDPFPKINFGYNYWGYLFGKIWVNEHFDDFVDNNVINFAMLCNINNVDSTEKVFLNENQAIMYKFFKKLCIDRVNHCLEHEIKVFSSTCSSGESLDTRSSCPVDTRDDKVEAVILLEGNNK